MCISPLSSPRFLLSAFILNRDFLLKTNKNVPQPSSTLLHYCFFLHKLLKQVEYLQSPFENYFSIILQAIPMWLLPISLPQQLSLKAPKTSSSPNLIHIFKQKVLNLLDTLAAFITADHSLEISFPLSSRHYTNFLRPSKFSFSCSFAS